MGITLRQGRWEPDRSVVAQRQVQFRKGGEEQSNMQGKLGAVIVIFITMMIVLSTIINMDAACIFPLLIALMFGVIIAIVILLSNRVRPAPYIDWEEQYPVVEVDRTMVHLNNQQIDFSNVGGAEVDRYHNEFQLINKALKRRSIPLDAYKDMTEMVLAIQGALEANGIRVFDKYPEWNGPSSLKPIPSASKSVGPSSMANLQVEEEEFQVVTPVEEEPENPPVTPVTNAAKPEDISTTVPVVGTKGPKDQVCSKCGAVISEDLIECPNCGTGI